MIERIDTYDLPGLSEDLTPLKFMRTIFVPAQKITATTSISAFTMGFRLVGREYQMGFIGSVIRKAGFSPAPGKSDDIPLANDWSRNGLTLDKCTYVTFELVVAMAQAEALCTIAFYDGKADRQLKPVPKPAKVAPQALIVDKKTGRIRTVHYLTAVEGARIPSERFLTQAIKKCAAEELKAEPRTLEIVFHDDTAYRFQPQSTFDRKARKVRT